MSDIVYLYGFVPAAGGAPPQSLRGMGGAPVRLSAFHGVQAVISDVSSTEFSQGVMDANIANLDWVGARGMEHERVVAWFVDNAEILPVPLFTLYSSEQALREDAAPRARLASAHLARLHNQREWDLKVSYDPQRLASHAATFLDDVHDIDAQIAAAADGRRFLLERKRADMLKNGLAGAARSTANMLLEDLGRMATAVVTMPLSRTDGSTVVLNAALLVRREEEAHFWNTTAERAAPLQEMGITIQLTGPWAPYRFLETEEAEHAADT
jgi:hypothetical protein